MTNSLFPEYDPNKKHKNGLTYLENYQRGNFIPPVALKFQTEMRTRMDKIENTLSQIANKLSK